MTREATDEFIGDAPHTLCLNPSADHTSFIITLDASGPDVIQTNLQTLRTE